MNGDEYTVTTNGNKQTFTGSGGFIDSLRWSNHSDKGDAAGLAVNHTIWAKNGRVITETYPGERVSASK